MTKYRLQKIIAEAGICSRRKAETLLNQNRVIINGKTARLGDKADPELDKIVIDSFPLVNKSEHKVILLNKPIGVISTCHDPQGRNTVLGLLPTKLRKGLHPVGRLDLNSRGAILLTNQGKLTLHLTHPRYLHTKTYHVWIEGIPVENALKEWRDGVNLNGQTTMKTSVQLLKSEKNKSLLKVILQEGRNRQIRRVAELLGHPVIDLKRTAIGCLELKNLKEGQWRELSIEECGLLIKSSKYKCPE